MKKYLIVFLSLSIMPAITSVTNAGFPVKCEDTINGVMKTTKGFEQKTLQDVLGDGTWAQFKDATRQNGSWENPIVLTCCNPCSDIGCKACPCDGNDPCTWNCRCCWGTTACSLLPD